MAEDDDPLEPYRRAHAADLEVLLAELSPEEREYIEAASAAMRAAWAEQQEREDHLRERIAVKQAEIAPAWEEAFRRALNEP